ncbi:MAG: hypothetical protein AB8E82_11500 [Aureispira sp.]
MNTPLDDLSDLQKPTYLVPSNVFLRYWTLLLLITSVVAAVLAVQDIESIVVTGGICTVESIVLQIANKNQIQAYKVIAVATFVFCVFCFLLIVILNWGPSDAQYPISRLGMLYTAWVLCYYVYARIKQPNI